MSGSARRSRAYAAARSPGIPPCPASLVCRIDAITNSGSPASSLAVDGLLPALQDDAHGPDLAGRANRRWRRPG